MEQIGNTVRSEISDDNWKNIPDRWNSTCKGYGVCACLAWLRISRQARWLRYREGREMWHLSVYSTVEGKDCALLIFAEQLPQSKYATQC